MTRARSMLTKQKPNTRGGLESPEIKNRNGRDYAKQADTFLRGGTSFATPGVKTTHGITDGRLIRKRTPTPPPPFISRRRQHVATRTDLLARKTGNTNPTRLTVYHAEEWSFSIDLIKLTRRTVQVSRAWGSGLYHGNVGRLRSNLLNRALGPFVPRGDRPLQNIN